jgi:hypothetical protein
VNFITTPTVSIEIYWFLDGMDEDGKSLNHRDKDRNGGNDER